MSKFKYKIGTHLVIHDRWETEYSKIITEKGIIPQWSFPFPFGVTDPYKPFLFQCIHRPAKIIDRKIEKWPGRSEAKLYKIKIFMQEYETLTPEEKDLIWIEESDLLTIFNPVNFIVFNAILILKIKDSRHKCPKSSK